MGLGWGLDRNERCVHGTEQQRQTYRPLSPFQHIQFVLHALKVQATTRAFPQKQGQGIWLTDSLLSVSPLRAISISSVAQHFSPPCLPLPLHAFQTNHVRCPRRTRGKNNPYAWPIITCLHPVHTTLQHQNHRSIVNKSYAKDALIYAWTIVLTLSY